MLYVYTIDGMMEPTNSGVTNDNVQATVSSFSPFTMLKIPWEGMGIIASSLEAVGCCAKANKIHRRCKVCGVSQNPLIP
jgi:hypothetical protein